MKVDKNTLVYEQRKYDWLCVEVDLTEFLTTFFTTKKMKYIVDYDDMYLLCVTH